MRPASCRRIDCATHELVVLTTASDFEGESGLRGLYTIDGILLPMPLAAKSMLMMVET
jgi:hypothetical protein